MAVTYYSSNLASSSKDAVRLWIGDTSTSAHLLTDEEIQYVLGSISSNVIMASAECCDLVVAKYSRQADFDNEGLAVKASQRAEAYRKRAIDLRRRITALADIFVGGRSISEKETRREDTDLVQPYFERDRDDYPGSVVDNSTS